MIPVLFPIGLIHYQYANYLTKFIVIITIISLIFKLYGFNYYLQYLATTLIWLVYISLYWNTEDNPLLKFLKRRFPAKLPTIVIAENKENTYEVVMMRSSPYLFQWSTVLFAYVLSLYFSNTVCYLLYGTVSLLVLCDFYVKVFLYLEKLKLVGSTRFSMKNLNLNVKHLRDDINIEIPKREVQEKEIEKHTWDWACSMKLFDPIDCRIQIALNKVTGLTIRVYPIATKEDLLLGNDVLLFLFLFDDWLESPQFTVTKLQIIIKELKENGPNGTEDPLELKYITALRDIYRRLEDNENGAIRQLFWQHMVEYFEANLRELSMRGRKLVPDVKDYFQLRRDVGGVNPSLDIQLAFYNRALHSKFNGRSVFPKEWLSERNIMYNIANDQICIYNDLTSIEKELRLGEISNIIITLANKKHCTLEEAFINTIKKHNSVINRFENIESEWISKAEENEKKIMRYRVYAFQSWIKGHIEWCAIISNYVVMLAE